VVIHDQLEPPRNRGRLLTAKQVADECFARTVSAAWVRRTVGNKLTLGHSTVRWFEQDVWDWIDAHREAKYAAPSLS
jgi:predicted DNA-binding transcriptional regulator AlpA